MTSAIKPATFQGIYEAPDVARYLLASRMAGELYPISSRNLIRWIRKGLSDPSLKTVPGRDLLLTFEDMVSMRVIAALRAYKVPWQDIYEAEEWLRGATNHRRPFATEQIWTTQSEVFTRFRNRIVSASRHGQMAFEMLTEHLIPISGLKFAHEVAHTWEPRNLIELNPLVQFGAPVVKGTNIPTRAIWGMVRAGDPISTVARAYNLSVEKAQAAVDWEDDLAA